jgi:hypothetical protein
MAQNPPHGAPCGGLDSGHDVDGARKPHPSGDLPDAGRRTAPRVPTRPDKGVVAPQAGIGTPGQRSPDPACCGGSRTAGPSGGLLHPRWRGGCVGLRSETGAVETGGSHGHEDPDLLRSATVSILTLCRLYHLTPYSLPYSSRASNSQVTSSAILVSLLSNYFLSR